METNIVIKIIDADTIQVKITGDDNRQNIIGALERVKYYLLRQMEKDLQGKEELNPIN